MSVYVVAGKVSDLPASSGFAGVPGSLGLSSSVNYNQAQRVGTYIPAAGSFMSGKSFAVSVQDYSQVTDPGGLYSGLVNSSCADGLSITDASGPDGIVLSYSPPALPVLTYDIDLPDRPDFTLADLTIPGNDTDLSLILFMPELFGVMETVATELIEDVLSNLSITALESLNEKIFASDVAASLTLRGLSAPAVNDMVLKAARQRASIARDLLILSRKANNTTAGVSIVAGLNSIKTEAHALSQQARLDNAKLNTSLSMQNIVLSAILYNAEVQRAHVQYAEFEQITRLEMQKLDLFKKQLQTAGKAMDGNSQLAQAYKKQLSIVQQVFESFEQNMKLSGLVLKLATAEVEVETANIKTDTMLVEGSADQAQNKAYQSKTKAMAYGMNTDGQLAQERANLTIKRGMIAKELLAIEQTTKNNVLDAENETLEALAVSVGARVTAVQTMFDLENLGNLNDSELSYSESHNRNLQRVKELKNAAANVDIRHKGEMDAEEDKERLDDVYRKSDQDKEFALRRFLDQEDRAADILHNARTQQTLNHKIQS